MPNTPRSEGFQTQLQEAQSVGSDHDRFENLSQENRTAQKNPRKTTKQSEPFQGNPKKQTQETRTQEAHTQTRHTHATHETHELETRGGAISKRTQLASASHLAPQAGRQETTAGEWLRGACSRCWRQRCWQGGGRRVELCPRRSGSVAGASRGLRGRAAASRGARPRSRSNRGTR